MAEGTRINKFLSEAGVCSRREADRQIEAGNVMIDGIKAETGSRVLPGQQVYFCGKPVRKEEEPIILLVHKPVGVVCTTERREKNNIKTISIIKFMGKLYLKGEFRLIYVCFKFSRL